MRKKIDIDNSITIEITEILWKTAKGMQLNCEGDEGFFAFSICNIDEEKMTLEAPEWLLKKLEWNY